MTNEKDQTPESVRELVERSSLGTPEAAALRATVSDEHAARIVALADSLEVWDDSVAPGGYVCTVCGIPTEDEPCAEHGPDAGPACPGCGHCCCPYKSEWQALGCAGESDVVRACELLRLPPGLTRAPEGS